MYESSRDSNVSTLDHKLQENIDNKTITIKLNLLILSQMYVLKGQISPTEMLVGEVTTVSWQVLIMHQLYQMKIGHFWLKKLTGRKK